MKKLFIIFILCTIFLSGCNNTVASPKTTASAATKLPNTTTPTRKPLPSATNTRTLLPSKTPTPTMTPQPVLSELMTNVLLTGVEHFDEMNTRHWWFTDNIQDISSGGMDGGGILEITGTSFWATGMGYNHSLQEGSGVMILYQFSPGSDFEIILHHGVWQTKNYRRFGVYAAQYPAANLFFGANGLGFNNIIGPLVSSPDQWRMLFLAIDKNQKFLAYMWNPENPSQYRIYEEQVNEKWEGLDWNFGISANQGLIKIDEVTFFTFDDYAVR